jgi:amino acid adenylation domain-containing protein
VSGSPRFDLPLGAFAVADERTAIVEPGRGRILFAELDRLAGRAAAKLRRLGVEPGARVGLGLRRSADAVAAIHGVLRAGAAWVPIDPDAPVERNAEILADCEVALTLVEQRSAESLAGAVARTAFPSAIEPIGEGVVGRALAAWAAGADGRPVSPPRRAPLDTACVFYTSGTTGHPKGWRMSHRAIADFAGWVARRFEVGEHDAFASQAPFHFAMSVLDVFASAVTGARIVLVPDEVRPFPRRVAEILAGERTTILFATPAFLSGIASLDDLESFDLGALRWIPFGGEVAPAPMLRDLRRRLPHPRYVHCWGSTETNVAVTYELASDEPLDAPPPIGRPSPHYEARVVAADGTCARPGTIGELQLRSAGLPTGYWKRAELDAERFVVDPDGAPWFRTGDLVVELPSGDLRYAGRLGRMVKIRGHRVEPGEVEARLYAHPAVAEVGVVAFEDDLGLHLVAHVRGQRVPVVELKRFCAVKLPAYMIPERFVFHEAMPRTPRGKLDLARLRELSRPG